MHPFTMPPDGRECCCDLPEHADSARIALDLAERESAHLRYTCNTLYAETEH